VSFRRRKSRITGSAEWSVLYVITLPVSFHLSYITITKRGVRSAAACLIAVRDTAECTQYVPGKENDPYMGLHEYIIDLDITHACVAYTKI